MLKSKRLAPPEMPNWPRWLRLELAAAYVGVSRTLFLREVDTGVWPAADHRGGVVAWDRKLLDEASDKRSGLGSDGGFDWEAAHAATERTGSRPSRTDRRRHPHRPDDDEIMRRFKQWGKVK